MWHIFSKYDIFLDLTIFSNLTIYLKKKFISGFRFSSTTIFGPCTTSLLTNYKILDVKFDENCWGRFFIVIKRQKWFTQFVCFFKTYIFDRLKQRHRVQNQKKFKPFFGTKNYVGYCILRSIRHCFRSVGLILFHTFQVEFTVWIR